MRACLIASLAAQGSFVGYLNLRLIYIIDVELGIVNPNITGDRGHDLKSRRRFMPEFKVKVAVEALREQRTTAELEQRNWVHPSGLGAPRRDGCVWDGSAAAAGGSRGGGADVQVWRAE